MEAADRPAKDLVPYDFRDDDHPLRLPWARLSGIDDLLTWAGSSRRGPPPRPDRQGR